MAEIKQILCPVDLSDTSRHALEHAFAFARWYKARVTVLHVLNVPLPVMPPAGVPVVDASALPPLRPEDVTEGVRRFTGSASGGDQNTANVVVVEGGPLREILRQAEDRRTDLLVMGTHGRSGFEALFLGSVTEKVLRSTHVPVLTVPPAVERVEAVVYKTILCPIEFWDPSTRALEYALTLAEETVARLILLHVVEQLVDAPQPGELSPYSLEQYRQNLEEDARARLRSAVPQEARVWCTPEERVLSGKAYRVILETAEQEKAEVIVMGVHGKGPLNRRLFGSTTHHVIREARSPVLTLRAWQMDTKPPDVIVLGAEWPERALRRAQLIEEGHEVVAVDTWPIPRLYRRPGMKPRALLIDLRGLPNPRETLDEVPFVLPPERVLVVTALGSLTAGEVRARGFHVIERPASIGQIVGATAVMLSRTHVDQTPHDSQRRQ